MVFRIVSFGSNMMGFFYVQTSYFLKNSMSGKSQTFRVFFLKQNSVEGGRKFHCCYKANFKDGKFHVWRKLKNKHGGNFRNP